MLVLCSLQTFTIIFPTRISKMSSNIIQHRGNVTHRHIKPSTSSGQSPSRTLASLNLIMTNLVGQEIRLAIREAITKFEIIQKELSCFEESMRSMKEQFNILQGTVCECKNKANKVWGSINSLNSRSLLTVLVRRLK